MDRTIKGMFHVLKESIIAGILLLLAVNPAFCKGIETTGTLDGMGVNIHFTGDNAFDLDMIRDGGFKTVRMDLTWASVEQVRGKYDFSQYDALTRGLMSRGIRPLYILDYSNTLYEDGGNVMKTEKGMDAFAKFARTAVTRYKGKGIMYELWNEPNLDGFWRNPNPEDYMRLASKVLPALRKADPEATLIAPGVSGVDLKYLEVCFKRGLLDLVDGVSLHPYRQEKPETVEKDLAALRVLIARYSPDKPDIPVICSEWGYSTAWKGISDELQGTYLPRQQLINLSLGIPVSIWYDWHDDGEDPTEQEHNFGVVEYGYDKKASYEAASELRNALAGYRFIKRMPSAPEDYLLLFSKGSGLKMAAWTTGTDHNALVYPDKSMTLTAKPGYVDIPSEAGSIKVDAAWSVTPRSQAVAGSPAMSAKLYPAFTASITNPFPHKVDVSMDVSVPEGVKGGFTGTSKASLEPGKTMVFAWRGRLTRRDSADIPIGIKLTMNGITSIQTMSFKIMDRISVYPAPLRDGRTQLLVDGVGKGTDASGYEWTVSSADSPEPIAIAPSGTVTDSPISSGQEGRSAMLLPKAMDMTKGVTLTLSGGEDPILKGDYRMVRLNMPVSKVKAISEGDPKVKAEATLAESLHDADGTLLEDGFTLSYGFKEGWNFIQIMPKGFTKVPGTPKALGMWVKGNGTGLPLRMRFVDKNSRTYQPEFPKIDFTGWRFITAPLDDPNVASWGGKAGETTIKYPLFIDTLALLDGTNTKLKGEVEFTGFVLLY